MTTGNKPPWTVPAKGKMSKFETKRAMGYLKIKPFEMPKSFPIVTILVSSVSCVVHLMALALTEKLTERTYL